MQAIVSTSTKALSPDCGMVAGVLREVLSGEDGTVFATFGHACRECGDQTETVVLLPGELAPELQLYRGQACRICRDGERYIVRGGAQ